MAWSEPAGESQRSFGEILSPDSLAELRRLQLRTRRSLSADIVGNYRSAFRGSGLKYSDLREYQPGDEVKSIHWKASARSGRVYVKSYEEDRQLRIVLCLDISRSTLFGMPKTKHRKILELAALITLLAQSNQDALGLCLFSSQIEQYLPVRRSPSQFQRVLSSILSERELPQATDVQAALQHLERYQRKPAVIFIVSDFICAPFEEALRRLSFRHDTILCCVQDSWDSELPAVGIVEFEDLESGRRVLFDCGNSRSRNYLAEYHRQRLDAIRQCALRCGADSVVISERPLAALNALMRERARRIAR